MRTMGRCNAFPAAIAVLSVVIGIAQANGKFLGLSPTRRAMELRRTKL